MYKKILVCLDFSDSDSLVLKRAADLKSQNSCEIHLCHVIRPVASFAIHGYYYPLDIDLEKAALARAERKMKEAASVLQLVVSDQHIFFDNPKTALLDCAKRLKADLILMVGRHHNEIGMLGSVASYVTSNAECDVLVVHKI